jgi:hypothetical protein
MKRHQWKVAEAATFASMLLLICAHKYAQSFDCSKASTAVEHAICSNKAPVYRDRIAYFKSLKSADIVNCQKIADRYRPLASAHPGEAPLSVVAAAPASGVTLTEPLIRMVDPQSALPQWAKRQTPPFTVSEELIKSLFSMNDWTLVRSRGTRLPGELGPLHHRLALLR